MKGLSTRVRLQPNYENIISLNNLTADFLDYSYKHFGVSKKRLARAYCLKHHLLDFFYRSVRRVLHIPEDGLDLSEDIELRKALNEF